MRGNHKWWFLLFFSLNILLDSCHTLPPITPKEMGRVRRHHLGKRFRKPPACPLRWGRGAQMLPLPGAGCAVLSTAGSPCDTGSLVSCWLSKQATFLGLQTWRCWGDSPGLISTKSQMSWGQDVEGHEGLKMLESKAPELSQQRQSRLPLHLTRSWDLWENMPELWKNELFSPQSRLCILNMTLSQGGDGVQGEKGAKKNPRYMLQGFVALQTQPYPTRSYSLIFTFFFFSELKFNLLFSSWGGGRW